MADAATNEPTAPNPVLEAVAATDSAAASPGPGTGAVTPAMSELPSDQVALSLKVSLADLCAKGTALYAHKKYEEAAEVFSRATEMQSEMNGEMSPENAEILFLYGRALFEVGVSKSDVLGGSAPEPKKEPKNEASSSKSELHKIDEEKVSLVAASSSEGKSVAQEAEIKKPMFQFTGDENWDESDEEEVGPRYLLFFFRVPKLIPILPRALRAMTRMLRKRTMIWPSLSRS